MKQFSYKDLQKDNREKIAVIFSDADRGPVTIHGKYEQYILVKKSYFGFLKVIDHVKERESE